MIQLDQPTYQSRVIQIAQTRNRIDTGRSDSGSAETSYPTYGNVPSSRSFH